MFKRIIPLVALVAATVLSTHAAAAGLDSVLQISTPTDVRAGSSFNVTVRRVVKTTNVGVPNAPVEWQWYGDSQWIGGGLTGPDGYATFTVKAPLKGGRTYTLCYQSLPVYMNYGGKRVLVNRAYAPVKVHVR